ncbi:MAG: hypothetical protein IVW54_18480 [Candidatus Binataceae bacterium]|nr:hypothetical protein [Candidatus Binataceae bacterium]
MKFPAIVQVIAGLAAALLGGTAAAQAVDPQYAVERALYDKCKPHGIGGIETAKDEHIRFFFLADIERCKNTTIIVVQHVVKNLNPDDALPYRWITGSGGVVPSKFRHVLPPGAVDDRILTTKSYHETPDNGAHIEYGSDLSGDRPAMRWAGKVDAAKTDLVVNEIKTTYLLADGKTKRSLDFVFSSTVTDKITYRIKSTSHDLVLALARAPAILPAWNALLIDAKIKGTPATTIPALDKFSSRDVLIKSGIFPSAIDRPYTMLSLDSKQVMFSISGRARQTASWPIMILTKDGYPITSGVVEVLVNE